MTVQEATGKPAFPVGGEFPIKRRREFRKVHCNGFPSHSAPGLPSVMKDSRHDSLACDRRGSGARELCCNRFGICRASAEDRSNSRRACGRDIRAGWSRSVAPRMGATSGHVALP